MNLFVGNLSKEVTEEDLNDLFTGYGTVRSVKIIKDMFSGESRGFGFVEMSSNDEAEKAKKELVAHDLKGKNIVVNDARRRSKRKNKRGGGGGGHRGGQGGSRRY